MYLNCAPDTRNIQVSVRESVSADAQYSMTQIGQGAQKNDQEDIPSDLYKVQTNNHHRTTIFL